MLESKSITVPYVISISIPFPSVELAALICQVIRVDREPKPDIIDKAIYIDESIDPTVMIM